MLFSRKFFIGIIIVLFLVFFFMPAIRTVLIQGTFFIIRPLLLYGSNVGDSIQSFDEYISTHRGLIADNKELLNENMNLKERLVDYEILKQENAALKKIIPFIEGKPYGTIGSRVIGSFIDTTGAAMIIQGGKNQGISGGAFVLAGDRVLVGKIAKLYPDFSTVAPLRNVGTTLGVFIIPQSGLGTSTSTPQKMVSGLLMGKGDDLIVDLVPNEAPVHVGDLVVTNGFGEGGIRDLLIGEVVLAQKRETEAFQEIHVSEAIPIIRARNVFIITQVKQVK